MDEAKLKERLEAIARRRRVRCHGGLTAEQRTVEPCHPSSGCGDMLTADEVEFGKAIDQWKRDNRCVNPSFDVVLRIAKSLGYRKVGDA